MSACLCGHLFATKFQAKGFFEKELEKLRSEVLAAKDSFQHIDSECHALKQETSKAVDAHAAAVKVSLHSSFVDFLVLLPLSCLLAYAA